MDGFGNKLRQARNERALSLNEVEDVIKIGAKYLGALEDENLKLLPGKAYAIGFCKKYAEFLELDSHQSIEELKKLYFNIEAEDDRIINQEENIHKKQRIVIGISFIAIIILGLFLLINNTQNINLESNPITSLKSNLSSTYGTEKRSTSNKVLEINPQTKNEEKKPNQNIKVSSPNNEINVTAGLRLLSTSDKSWILVVVDGKEAFKGMIYKGQIKNFVGKSIKIKLGNAGSVDVTYNNEHLGYLGNMHQVVSKTFTENTEVR